MCVCVCVCVCVRACVYTYVCGPLLRTKYPLYVHQSVLIPHFEVQLAFLSSNMCFTSFGDDNSVLVTLVLLNVKQLTFCDVKQTFFKCFPRHAPEYLIQSAYGVSATRLK